ncbi:RNA pyrophosphohydrolase [bacterium HR34]|nr:RNA pyrophosphohydrolase [bacterium HR34]
MLREKSAGAIVFYIENKKPVYLFLKHRSGHLDIPKGNIEKGETPLHAAKREIFEETGLSDINFIEGFEEKINYYYKSEGELIYKEVVIFLAQTRIKEVKISPEHLGFEWLDYETAYNNIKFENSKKVFLRAHQFIVEKFVI